MTKSNKRNEVFQDIVIKLSKNKPDLRVEGMENIHPIYEALIALLRRQLKDDEVAKVVGDEESLRLALAADVFLEYLPKEQRDRLGGVLKSGKSLKEIVDQSALFLSEGKRTKDGKVLSQVSRENPDYFFKRSIGFVDLSNVYVEKSEVEKIKLRSEMLRGNSKLVKVACGVGAAVLLYLGFVAGVKYSRWRGKGGFSMVPENRSYSSVCADKSFSYSFLEKNL